MLILDTMNSNIYITKILCWLYAVVHFVVHITITKPIIYWCYIYNQLILPYIMTNNMTNIIGHIHNIRDGYIYITIVIQPNIQPTDNYITNYIINLLKPPQEFIRFTANNFLMILTDKDKYSKQNFQ